MNENNGRRSLEQVSALADGELQGEAFAAAVAALGEDDALRERWHHYHLVGEVLRSGRHAPCREPQLFVAALRERLALESIVRAPAEAPVTAEAAPERPSAQVLPLPQRDPAANEPVFRWKMVAGAASVAAAAAIGWAWVGPGGPQGGAGSQLALQQPPMAVQPVGLEPRGDSTGAAGSVLAASTAPDAAPAWSRTRVMVGSAEPQIMLRDPRLDELLDAHRQASGLSQMPPSFMRNATFDAPAR